MNESQNNATTDNQQPTEQKSELADLPLKAEQTEEVSGGHGAALELESDPGADLLKKGDRIRIGGLG